MNSDFVAISQALLTPVIAVATTYIAYQQYRIRRDERSLALYDRRLSLYKSVIAIVDRIQMGDELVGEDAMKWNNSVAEVEFVFGDEVSFVKNELFSAVFEYAMLTEPVRLGAKPFDSDCARAMGNVVSFQGLLQRVFSPYLRPAGSPLRRRKRLTVDAVKKLLKEADIRIESDVKIVTEPKDGEEKDVPF